MSTAEARGPALRIALAILGVAFVAVRGCTPADDARTQPRFVMVVGVDVSGSFRGSGHYEDALDFLAHYIHGHLEGEGELRRPDALFVAPVGGNEPGEAQGFRPIHDFRGKDPERIAEDLRAWFGGEDRLTDFNAFFRRISELTQQRGLALAPMNVVLVTDGRPDMRISGADPAGGPAAADAAARGGASGPGAATPASRTAKDPADPAADAVYRALDLDPLEYLSHSVTVRLLYPEPPVAAAWERSVERRRVRIWTADATVMDGWRRQLQVSRETADGAALWTWIRDNVDHPVRGRLF